MATGTLHRTSAGGVQRLGDFDSYRDAERAVERLGLPVERVRIVAAGPRGAGPGPGGLTAGRASLVGAALGAWLGMLTGLFPGLLLPGAPWATMLLGGLLIGAAAGVLLGLLTYVATDGPQECRYVVEVERAS